MVKLNLSAIQIEKINTNDINQKPLVEKNQVKNIPEPTKPRKKMTLNSLISGELEFKDSNDFNNAENKIIKEELIVKSNKVELSKLIKPSDELLQNSEINEIKKEELVSENTDNNKIVEKVNNEEVKTFSIADGDTNTNLITEISKDEIFSSYVSSFEKELQSLKDKNKPKSIKKEENVPEKNSSEENIIKSENVDIDKLIKEVKNNNVETKSFVNKNKFILNYRILGFGLVLILILTGIFLFLGRGLNVDRPMDFKANILENNNINNQNFENNPDNKVENIPDMDIPKNNNTINNDDVKLKIIKYFRNKQNNDKIN